MLVPTASGDASSATSACQSAVTVGSKAMHARAPDSAIPGGTSNSTAPGTSDESTPTIWPFIAAVLTSITFLGSIFTAWALPIGAVPVGVSLIAWFWPSVPGHHIGQPRERSAATRAQEAM